MCGKSAHYLYMFDLFWTSACMLRALCCGRAVNSVWNVGYVHSIMKVFKSAFIPCRIVSYF